MGSIARNRKEGRGRKHKAAQAEEKVKKMEDHFDLTKTKIEALLDHKDNAIQQLKRIFERQREVTTSQEDKVKEL